MGEQGGLVVGAGPAPGPQGTLTAPAASVLGAWVPVFGSQGLQAARSPSGLSQGLRSASPSLWPSLSAALSGPGPFTLGANAFFKQLLCPLTIR